MSFRVEVTNPFHEDDSREERYDCANELELASRIEDLTGQTSEWSQDAATETLWCARFEWEDLETGRTVTAERVGDLVGGRS